MERWTRDTEKFKHTISWPIPQGIEYFIVCGFGDRNYSDTKLLIPHQGIDIQVKAGTKVLAPDEVRFLYHFRPDTRGLVDVTMVGRSTHICYFMAHLDPKTLSPKIAGRIFRDPKLEIYLNAGEYVGRVGTWPYILGRNVQVRPEVKRGFNRDFHHLHLETSLTCHDPGSSEFLWEISDDKNLIDPLYVLKPTP